MKRERNTFFTNYQAQNSAYIPNIPNNFTPYEYSQTNQEYYNGPTIGITNDFENRLSKIERQINRLDYRISKLESIKDTTTIPSPKEEYQNMYMI